MKNVMLSVLLTAAASTGFANAVATQAATSVGQRFAVATQMTPAAARTMVANINAAAASNPNFSAAMAIGTQLAEGPNCVGACDQAVTALVSSNLADLRTPEVVFNGYANLMDQARQTPDVVIGFIKKARETAGTGGDIGQAMYRLIAQSQGFTGTPAQIQAQVDQAVSGACKLPN